MTKIFSILLLCLFTTTTSAHDWYSKSCCGGHDCHPVSCEELTEMNNGNIKYQSYYFSPAQVHPSVDNKCHVCLHEYHIPTEYKLPICVYIQQLT